MLITGNKGFVGSYIENYFENAYDCYGISRDDNIDIRLYENLEKLDISPEIVIHTVASFSDDVQSSFETNVIGTLNICKYAKEKQSKHLILISSLSVYEREENEYFNLYGRTKKQAEEIAESYCEQHNICLTILRLSQVYDDCGIARKNQGMLYYFIDMIKKNKRIEIFGEKNPLRNYIHIDYLSLVIEDVIKKEKSGIYNIIEKKNHTIIEIAYMIFDILNIKPEIEFLVDKPNIGNVYIPTESYDNEVQSISLRNGIERIINYEK